MAERQALVVDDSRSACFAMRKYLEKHNYFVTTALNTSEATNYLQSHQPRVIFLDQIMPGVTGLEFLKALKTNPATVAIPVVMWTSIEQVEFRQEAQGSGAMEVLYKPPDLNQLGQLLQTIENAVPAPVAVISAAAEPAVPTAQSIVLIPQPVQEYAALGEDISKALHHLTDEIFVQISELRAQVKQIEGGQLTGPDRDAFRRIAREEAETLYQSVQQELERIRKKLDAIDWMQRRDRNELMRDARTTASAEARTVAESAVADAVNRFSHRLTDAILKAMGKH
jgi:CheY-like chemotaxis protein